MQLNKQHTNLRASPRFPPAVSKYWSDYVSPMRAHCNITEDCLEWIQLSASRFVPFTDMQQRYTSCRSPHDPVIHVIVLLYDWLLQWGAWPGGVSGGGSPMSLASATVLHVGSYTGRVAHGIGNVALLHHAVQEMSHWTFGKDGDVLSSVRL